jgi:segregation and condensation protein A
MSSVAALDLDLDVFSGPFDLLFTLVLREEIDLLELQLAEVVLAYLDHLEARGELDLETATEFIVLLAALLELKSRLMLTGEDDEQLLDIEPGEAAEELLARMLDARRYRSAAGHLRELLATQDGVRFRGAPPPPQLLRAVPAPVDGILDPAVLGQALGRLLVMPPAINLRHITIPRVSLAERLQHLRVLLRRGRFTFEEAVGDADRMTVAITVFALLELYKRGEAAWEQSECFGEIHVQALTNAASVADAPAIAAGAAVAPVAPAIAAGVAVAPAAPAIAAGAAG